jgi:hypothetical protein
MNCYKPTIAASGTGGCLKAFTLTFFSCNVTISIIHILPNNMDDSIWKILSFWLSTINSRFLRSCWRQLRRRRNPSTGDNRPPATTADGTGLSAFRRKTTKKENKSTALRYDVVPVYTQDEASEKHPTDLRSLLRASKSKDKGSIHNIQRGCGLEHPLVKNSQV